MKYFVLAAVFISQAYGTMHVAGGRGGHGGRVLSHARPSVEHSVYDDHYNLGDFIDDTPVVEVAGAHDDVLVEQYYGPGEQELGDMGTYATSGLYTQFEGKPSRLLYRRVRPVARGQLAARRRVVLTDEAELGYDGHYEHGYHAAPARRVVERVSGHGGLYDVAPARRVVERVSGHRHGLYDSAPARRVVESVGHGYSGHDDLYNVAPARRVVERVSGHGHGGLYDAAPARRVVGHGYSGHGDLYDVAPARRVVERMSVGHGLSGHGGHGSFVGRHSERRVGGY